MTHAKFVELEIERDKISKIAKVNDNPDISEIQKIREIVKIEADANRTIQELKREGIL